MVCSTCGISESICSCRSMECAWGMDGVELERQAMDRKSLVFHTRKLTLHPVGKLMNFNSF